MKKILIGLLFCLFLCVPFANAEPGVTASKLRTFNCTPNTEPDLAGYRLYHEKKFLVEIPGLTVTGFEFLVANLLEGNNVFNLTAYDEAGNESGFSADAIFFYDSVSPAVPNKVTVLKQTPNTRVTIETFD